MTHDIDREHLELVVPTVPEPRQRAWGCAGWVVAVVVVLVAAALPPVHAQSLPAPRSITLAEPVPALPTPTGAIGTALYTASMTWCAPRGDQCTNWGGDARLAAVHSFTFGDTPYWVRLWRGEDHAD